MAGLSALAIGLNFFDTGFGIVTNPGLKALCCAAGAFITRPCRGGAPAEGNEESGAEKAQDGEEQDKQEGG